MRKRSQENKGKNQDGRCNKISERLINKKDRGLLC